MASILKRRDSYSVRYKYKDHSGKPCVEWDLIHKIPLPRDAPKVNIEERTIWDEKTMLAALQTIENPALHLAVHMSMILSLREGEILGLQPSDLDFDAASAKRSPEPSGRWLHHQGIPGQAGTQHYFPHPEKHQNRILLPYHLHDLCTERGIEEVAESVGGRRDERPGTLP